MISGRGVAKGWLYHKVAKSIQSFATCNAIVNQPRIWKWPICRCHPFGHAIYCNYELCSSKNDYPLSILSFQNLLKWIWPQEACGLEYCNCRSRWPAFEQDSGVVPKVPLWLPINECECWAVGLQTLCSGVQLGPWPFKQNTALFVDMLRVPSEKRLNSWELIRYLQNRRRSSIGRSLRPLVAWLHGAAAVHVRTWCAVHWSWTRGIFGHLASCFVLALTGKQMETWMPTLNRLTIYSATCVSMLFLYHYISIHILYYLYIPWYDDWIEHLNSFCLN